MAISLIPFLIFRAINNDIFNKKSNAPDTTDASGQAQPTNTVFTESEYKEHVNDAFNKLSSNTEPKEPINNENEDLNQTLISRTQPNVQVISRTGNPGQTEETTIVSRINNERIRDGKAVIRSRINEEEAHFTFVIAADHVIPDNNAMKSSAAACGMRCEIVDNGTGVDLSFGASVRTGATQGQAMNKLLRSEVAQGILSDCEVEVQAITRVHS
ncbi:hypothetical protein IC220_06940 [Wolbachia endosymbiont of Pentalonia nigronervosa]|nr:hypothetical protein [Wolbachia endosymbiont of Pentalonia nigronervosa]